MHSLLTLRFDWLICLQNIISVPSENLQCNGKTLTYYGKSDNTYARPSIYRMVMEAAFRIDSPVQKTSVYLVFYAIKIVRDPCSSVIAFCDCISKITKTIKRYFIALPSIKR